MNTRPILFLLLLPVSITGCKTLSSNGHTIQQDCAEAREAGTKLSNFFATEMVQQKADSIWNKAVDGKEHAASFGKDVNSKTITSSIFPGNSNNGYIPKIENPFADLHNHPQNKPPSSGDIYNLIDQGTKGNQSYQKIILLPNKTLYALVITDIKNAVQFNKSHPRVLGFKDAQNQYQPTFPKEIVDELNQLKGWQGASEETAIAHLLHQYKTGIALLKLDPNRSFKKLIAEKKTDKNGLIVYSTKFCAD